MNLINIFNVYINAFKNRAITQSLDSFGGFCCSKNSTWRSEIKREQKNLVADHLSRLQYEDMEEGFFSSYILSFQI